MNKSYRIHTNISSDTCLNVNMQQDFDFLEILSLKLKQKDAYRLYSSNYGVIVGRVLANDAFGIPNAKVSVFIEKTDGDSVEMETIYPYKEVTTKDKDERRYNILPDYSDDECYRVVGTFPNKRLVLDDDVQLDVYDKYWKYSTVTNNAGDFMLFAVPTGSVTVHIEMDLSDIGVLSQKPRDFEYKGYNLTLFDSPSQFKESTNLDDLAQIFSQNKSIFVYPFWGDADNGVACITRSDVQIQYKFEPTCVFIGSIISDNEGHAIGHRCAPDIENGMNNQLVAGNGTIEMIRKTTDGLVEEYPIQGNQLIDENGVWCYQIPMNLDYIGTDEYGNIVPTDNPNKGIPTRAQVRFRISKNETSDEGFSRHTAKYLVPMNPIFSEENGIVRLDNGSTQECGTVPFISDSGADIEKMYAFGSETPLHCFRDLYWNNVYSVKNYIPKSQVAHRAYAKNYAGLKGSNLAEDQNPIPFNKLRVDLPFVYIVVCILFTIVMWIIYFINKYVICMIINTIIDAINSIIGIKFPIIKKRIFSFIKKIPNLGCIPLSAGVSEGNVAYIPGCECKSGFKASKCPEDMEGSCTFSDDREELMDKIQRNLAQEFKIVKLDLYQDWINGCLYMPLWYWRKRKKKTFLFGLISRSARRAKNEYCSDSDLYSRLKTYVTCNIKYYDNDFTVSDNKNSMPDSEKRWHKNRSNQVRYKRGLIKPVENKNGLTAYYYVAVQATSDNHNPDAEMIRREPNFKAVRLFATDIILLGNLNKDNIYGIPQFFNCLPSTTANIPPIATIEEIKDPDEEEEVLDKDISGNADDSGNTITTGMDWNNDGNKMTPAYKTGLFIDLACTYASTKPKSCINVERVSELGVSLDMTYNMAYNEGGNSVQYGKIENDGFISKYELDDMENRAMFATLNHIGFIPQEYQDLHGYYTTQVPDTNTNYLIPKFKYIYPVDFDGRLQLPMDIYKNGFDQATFDEKDESYITFKMGAERDLNKNNNSEQRIRHFYHERRHDGMYDMPLYNNSYYFYFGIKKGSTAIDKFNQMFNAPCFKRDKNPFTLVIETQGRSYCPSAYTPTVDACTCADEVDKEAFGNCAYRYEDNKNKAYGRIRVASDDIRTPYSYKLFDQFGDIVIEENGMTVDSFVIGGQIDESGRTVSNCNGWIYYQILNNANKYEKIDSSVTPYYEDGLTNQEYILQVTDVNGKTIIEKIKLDIPKISGEYKATSLGTKFYNSATTRIDYICHDDTAFYGKIEMTSFSIDGYNCRITSVTNIGYINEELRYKFCVNGVSDDINPTNLSAVVEISVLNDSEENRMRNCMCDENPNVNDIAREQAREGGLNMSIEGANVENYFLGFKDAVIVDDVIIEPATITFYFYQPNTYVVKIIQGCTDCGNLVEDNFSEEIITISNGSPFITTLNEMPTRFILGTSSDTSGGTIANTSYFYNATAVRDETDYNIKGWYGLHQEDSYMFSRRNENKTYNYNQHMWEDYFRNTTDDVASPGMKRTILKFKFDTMFKLAEGAYITSDSSCQFLFKATGGVSPILYRMVAPDYGDLEKTSTQYLFEDFFQSKGNTMIASIVPDNYSLPFQEGSETHYQHYNGYTKSDDWFNYQPDKPHFNDGFYKDENRAQLIGNYFAAFTRDGSYISKTNIDGVHIKIERSPSFASISPDVFCNGDPKVKGKDIIRTIDDFKLVHTTSANYPTCNGKQMLHGDILDGVVTLPYLRALYVDRRLDYDITVLAPVVGSNFSLYHKGLGQRNRPWKSGRLTGWIYNGIEMSYDNEYNIISADTHSARTISYKQTGEEPGVDDIEYTAATFNRRLEYTYKYDSAHKCLTCGFQFDDKAIKECTDNSTLYLCCPKCYSTNIKLYHGEIVNQRETNKIISSYNICDNEMISAYTWEATSHILDKNGNYDNYSSKTGNFNSGETSIPGIIMPNQEGQYTLDDAVTYYHKWIGEWDCDWNDGEPRWGEWHVNKGEDGKAYGFDKSIDAPSSNVPLIKEFYSSSINGFDVRHLYWSMFNYERLNLYTSGGSAPNQDKRYGEEAIDNKNNPFYVYHYPYAGHHNPQWYNGDFNRDDVVANITSSSGRVSQYPDIIPYPTKRFIDIGNLPSVSRYSYDVQSCSYVINSEITTDGRIKAVTEGGESVEINFEWKPPITVITPNGASKDYANITYNCINTKGDEPFTDYAHFIASKASIMFKYNSYTCDGFEVYTKSPRLIQVLPYIDTPKLNGLGVLGSPSIDGIGFYKTSNKGDEFGKQYGNFGNGYTLDGAIEHITLDNGTFIEPYKIVWDRTGIQIAVNILLPENVTTSSTYTTKYGLNINVEGQNVFFKKDDEFLTSDDDDFTNIIFNKNDISLTRGNQMVNVFTVLVDREYRFEEDDNLVKHVRTIETSDLFDCRDLFMKITLTDSSETLTYVEMRKEYQKKISAASVDQGSISEGEPKDIEVEVEDQEGNQSTGEIKVPTTDLKPDVPVGEDTTKIFTQVITFDMAFDARETTEVPDRQNEAFADYSMMSYTFRFRSKQNEEYDVTPSEVTMLNGANDSKILRFVVRWPTNMGILADTKWAGGTISSSTIPVSVFARTTSNFIYKLSYFNIKFCCGQETEGGCEGNDVNVAKEGMLESTRYITHITMTDEC